MIERVLKVFVLVFVFRTANIQGLERNRNNETELIDTILNGYNRQARPIRDLSQPINVSVGMHLTKVLDLDERSEILTIYLWFDVAWVDELLQWDPSDFGGIESVTLLPTQVWLPDFGITNTADRIYYEDHMRFFRISLRYNGTILWHPGGIYKTSCPLTVTYFPFDTQLCQLSMLNWEYDGYEQLIWVNTPSVQLDSSYRENGEWRLDDSWACSDTEIFPGEGPLGFANFYMVMARKARYSIINVIVPIILLSLMDLLVFWLPAESGEKVSLGITVLLSFSVFLLVVDERMPRTSDTIPLLTIYLSCVMATTGLSLFLTVFILHLNYKTHNAPVPRWLNFLLCMKRRKIAVKGNEDIIVKSVTGSMVNNNGKLNSYETVVERTIEIEENPNSKESKSRKKQSLEEEWKDVVKRIDHAFFFLFLIIFSFLLLIMMYPYDNDVKLNKNAKCPYG